VRYRERVASLWNRLTRPSAALSDSLQQRQASVLAAALVFILPVWLVTVSATITTRAVPLPASGWALAVVATGLAFGAYWLSRTSWYRVAAVLLIVTAIGGANLASLLEHERVRAIVSMLYGTTGVLYAAIFINTRATLIAALAELGLFILFSRLHPALEPTDFLLPMFLLGFILALTVVTSGVRESHLRTIQSQASRLAATLQSTLDAMVVVDGEGRVTAWSPRCETVFGIGTERALGQPLPALVASPADAQRLERALSRAAATRLEFEARGPGDQRLSCEASIAPLTGADRTGAVVVLRDVTERKQLEARLMMTDRLETMGRMVAGVAHEINNPLGYVQANLRALEQDLTEPTFSVAERSELLAETLSGTRRIQTIVKDLLSFSRHTGADEELAEVLVEPTLEAALHIAHVHVLSAGANVMRQYGDVGVAMAVEARLGQVFLNLLMNAVQALPAAGGRREILLTTRREGATVVVGVRDFGAGMTPEVKGRLFTPFFTTKPAGQGTGLGLSIAHALVRGFGGEIRVESAPGQGALFEVVLPTTPGGPATSGE
jgi:PAS domain S-box-containing protein